MSGARILLLTGLLLVAFAAVSLFMQSPWEGVDVAVVETKAEELGAAVSGPLLNVQGDLQLFVFTMAGAIGGFVLGYVWRGLFGSEGSARRRGEAKAAKEG